MAVNLKRVFYVEYLAGPAFEQVLGRRHDITLDRVLNDTPDAEAEAVLAHAHAYQIGSARDEIAPKYHVTSALLRRTPHLLVVSTNGAGYDTVEVDACTDAGVLVVNQAGGNKEAVAEHALGMMIVLAKRIIETDRVMRRQADIRRTDFMGNDLYGRTIGIVGIGHIGTRLAELCRGLFRMHVLAYDPYLSAEEVEQRGAVKVELDELLRQSDFVSVHCPRTAETRGMFGAAQYALMQRHAFFITTARGGIHDEAALAAALNGRLIAGAGLDVWEREPPPPDHPLLRFDNVVASPHTAGVSRQARTNVATIAAEQLLAIFDGKRPRRVLNPEAWAAFAARFERTFGFAVES